MTERNESFAPPTMGHGISNVGLDRFLMQKIAVDLQAENDSSIEPPMDQAQAETTAAILADVEEFARGWIGRIRRLIHRSSQLIERESLLAGAIARLDQQKAEWSKRTAAKEEGLRDQSKRLTEAWLEVESQRRKAIQGSRFASAGAAKQGGGPVVATPVGTVVPSPTITQPAAMSSTTTSKSNGQSTAAGDENASEFEDRPTAVVHSPGPAVGGQMNLHPASCNAARVADRPGMGQVMTVANTPVVSGRPATAVGDGCDQATMEQAEAAKRQRIEEFKRMQRALRANRNT